MNDVARSVHSVLLDPCLNFAALTDKFGRVSLLDLDQFVIVRMWKGYREAQCDWIRRPDSHSSLVIYAPYRGLLEIWDPFGSRIGAGNVGLECRLFGARLQDGLSSCFLMTKTGEIYAIEIVLD